MTRELLLSGLPLWWETGPRKLFYGAERKVLTPAVRRLGEIRAVLNPIGEPGREEDGRALYYMYRDLNLPEHRALFEEKEIRYDITVLEPGSIGLEYIKTAGHYHPLKQGVNCTYPEVYEVLHGRACYLMQKPHDLQEPQKGLVQVIVVDAGPGDKVLIPPDFGHITINPGVDFLVMCNLVAAAFQSVYEPLQEMGGGGYYGLVSAGEGTADVGDGHGNGAGRGSDEGAADGGPFFVVNPRYATPPQFARVHPQDVPQFSLLKDTPQYSAFVDNPTHFEFLTHPEDFAQEFERYLQNLL